jgi:hypothetical protein
MEEKIEEKTPEELLESLATLLVASPPDGPCVTLEEAKRTFGLTELEPSEEEEDWDFCPPNCEICATDLAAVEEEEKLRREDPVAYALACLLEALDFPKAVDFSPAPP